MGRLGRLFAAALVAAVVAEAARRGWCADALRDGFDRVRPEIAGAAGLLLEGALLVVSRRRGRAERPDGRTREGRRRDPSPRRPSLSEVLALAHRPDTIWVASAEGRDDDAVRPIVLPTGDLVIRRRRGEAETGDGESGSLRPALETWIDRARRSRDDRGETS